MMDDLAGKKTGERIQIIREAKGFSREVVAQLVGHSASWLRDLEKARRNPPRLDMLVHLAKVLQVSDVSILVGTDLNIPGETSLPLASFSRVPHPAVPAIREAIHDPLLTLPEHCPDVTALTARVEQAWRLWHASPTQRTDVGRLLPALITDARVAARTSDEDRRAAHAALASVYALCEQLLAWASEAELLWLISDRGLAAAHEADQPEALAMSAWVLGNVRRSVSDFDGALELVNDATALLRPRLESGPDSLRGIWGALHLHAAVTCARSGREGDAWRYWDEGNRTAEHLGGYHHPTTQFGASNVAVHAVSIGADLSKSKTVRDRAAAIDPGTVPSLERRSRMLIETARARTFKKDYGSALHWLQKAYQVSSENVHYSPLARGMAFDAVTEGGPLVERDARAFATTLNLPV